MSTQRLARRSLLAAMAAGLALVGLAGPADAHDRLVSSDPADGATVVELPAAITLEFSAEVVPTGTQVVVTTGGADVAAAPAEVQGSTVTAALPPDLANGDYDVAWRAVSSDGHPIEGSFAFVLAVPAPEPTPSPDPTDQAATAATDGPATLAPQDATASADPDDAAAAADATPTIDPSPAPEDGPPSGSHPWVALIVGLAVVTTMIALLASRRRGMRSFGPPGQD